MRGNESHLALNICGVVLCLMMSICGDYFSVTCERCSFDALPFSEDRFSDGPVITTPSNIEDIESDEFNCFLRKGLHFIHLNARSVLPKLELIVLASKTKAAVIGVSET